MWHYGWWVTHSLEMAVVQTKDQLLKDPACVKFWQATSLLDVLKKRATLNSTEADGQILRTCSAALKKAMCAADQAWYGLQQRYGSWTELCMR